MVLGLSVEEWTAIGSLAALGTLALSGWSLYRHERSRSNARVTDLATPPAATSTFDPAAPVPLDRSLTGQELLQHTVYHLTKLDPVPSEPIGRNDPCPCGSGRKYKKCHGGP
jgi:uncharacterized protein YecA (UPF0149 family)